MLLLYKWFSMKKIYIPVILLLIIAVGCAFNYNDYVEAHTDREAPVINILNNDLTFYESDDFNYLDYVEITDNFGNYKVNIINEEESRLPGERTIEIEAIDDSGNKSSEFINVNIIADNDWHEYVNDNTYNYIYRRYENDNLVETKGYADKDAFHLAENFIGMKGSCNEVAQAFIDAYFGEGYDVLLGTYPITLEEAKPGDIIFYTNGGIGQQHYATYLGGFSALQGNINGTTFIGCVYMNRGSAPQFRRLVGIE